MHSFTHRSSLVGKRLPKPSHVDAPSPDRRLSGCQTPQLFSFSGCDFFSRPIFDQRDVEDWPPNPTGSTHTLLSGLVIPAIRGNYRTEDKT